MIFFQLICIFQHNLSTRFIICARYNQLAKTKAAVNKSAVSAAAGSMLLNIVFVAVSHMCTSMCLYFFQLRATCMWHMGLLLLVDQRRFITFAVLAMSTEIQATKSCRTAYALSEQKSSNRFIWLSMWFLLALRYTNTYIVYTY